MARQGTLTSSTFTLMTMIGGGSLSLPLAFSQAGALASLFLLLLVAVSVYVSLMYLIDIDIFKSRSTLHPNYKSSYESACSNGSERGKLAVRLCLASICFAGIVAYAVLLRDLLSPIADTIGVGRSTDMNAEGSADESSKSSGETDGSTSGPSLSENLTMLIVLALITPLTMMRTLSALRYVTMFSVANMALLCLCIVYKSTECNFTDSYDSLHDNWTDYVHLWPSSWKRLVEALPIFTGPFICHFNLLTVHGELQNASRARMQFVIRIAVSVATVFYATIGTAGMMYGNCVIPEGEVEDNILLNFDDDDVVMNVGKVCLTLTISLSLPMMVLPCRDIILRMIMDGGGVVDDDAGGMNDVDKTLSERTMKATASDVVTESMRQPLLLADDIDVDVPRGGGCSVLPEDDDAIYFEKVDLDESESNADKKLRVPVTLCIVLGGAILACLVKNVDVVWELQGSSVVLMVGFLIPCKCFVDLNNNFTERGFKLRRILARCIIAVFIPIMCICSCNAVYNVFWLGSS